MGIFLRTVGGLATKVCSDNVFGISEVAEGDLGEDIARTRYAMLYAPVRVGAKRRVVSERPIRNMHALFLLTFTTPSRLV